MPTLQSFDFRSDVRIRNIGHGQPPDLRSVIAASMDGCLPANRHRVHSAPQHVNRADYRAETTLDATCTCATNMRQSYLDGSRPRAFAIPWLHCRLL